MASSDIEKWGEALGSDGFGVPVVRWETLGYSKTGRRKLWLGQGMYIDA